MAAAIRQDPELKEMLSQLEHVKTGNTFKRWKGSFLNRWQEFLEEENVESADVGYREFSATMDNFCKLVDKVNGFIDREELSDSKVTVKARNSLNEMSKLLTSVIWEQDALIPQTGAEEKKKNYNKFHMGAVLIRENFDEYGRLCSCKETLTKMRNETLGEVADKQILEEMDNYSLKLQKFCDVMADLGLFGTLALGCRSGGFVRFHSRRIP